MLTPSRSRRVFAYQQPCDMRKQYDSLAALVTGAMDHDFLSGDLYLFVGRTRRRAKVLYFDGTGLCVFAN
jgi:transposase